MITWYRLGDYVLSDGIFVYDTRFNIWYTWLEFCHMLDMDIEDEKQLNAV